MAGETVPTSIRLAAKLPPQGTFGLGAVTAFTHVDLTVDTAAAVVADLVGRNARVVHRDLSIVIRSPRWFRLAGLGKAPGRIGRVFYVLGLAPGYELRQEFMDTLRMAVEAL